MHWRFFIIFVIVYFYVIFYILHLIIVTLGLFFVIDRMFRQSVNSVQKVQNQSQRTNLMLQ
jgi:hypothetical protein